jgi:hypothetical protein
MSGPDVWGPHGWKFIHYVTLGYPFNPTEEEKNKYRFFFYNLDTIIPCAICGNNYSKHLKMKPLTDEILNNRTKMIEWGIDMHNLVNIEHNKKIISYDEGKEMILQNTKDCKYVETFDNKSNHIIIVLVVIILIQFMILANRKN